MVQYLKQLVGILFHMVRADAFGEKGREAGSGLHSIPPYSVLHVNIELVSFKPVINVSGDSMVLKKILKEGEGAFTANEGADVTGKKITCISFFKLS